MTVTGHSEGIMSVKVILRVFCESQRPSKNMCQKSKVDYYMSVQGHTEHTF